VARLGLAIDVAATAEHVLSLISDYHVRERFLPDGWRFLSVLTENGSSAGSQIEIEAQIGPAPLRYVFELLSIEEGQVVEGAQEGANYVTTWTVLPQGDGCAVECLMQYEYGGFIGEFFAGRRLSRALRQMLERLKQVAEAKV